MSPHTNKSNIQCLATNQHRTANTVFAYLASATIAILGSMNQASASSLTTQSKITGGYESNPFLAPSSGYIDYAKLDVPYIEPEQHAGRYTRLKLTTNYNRLLDFSFAHATLITRINYDGKFFTSQQTNNANEQHLNFSIGSEHPISFVKKGKFYFGAKAGLVEDLYFDRDSGEEQRVDDIRVGDRYNYDYVGLITQISKKSKRYGYSIKAGYQNRDYDDPKLISQYDHSRLNIDVNWNYSLSKSTKLSLQYGYQQHDYDERPSRSDSGRLLKRNPAREYRYNLFGSTLRYRWSKQLVTYFQFDYKKRSDQYQSYDNYDRYRVKTRLRYELNKKHKFRFALAYFDRDYPNAFAFNDILQREKKYTGLDIDVKYRYNIEKGTYIWLALGREEEKSTDKRYEFTNVTNEIGIKFDW